jgi:hypothetical protein
MKAKKINSPSAKVLLSAANSISNEEGLDCKLLQKIYFRCKRIVIQRFYPGSAENQISPKDPVNPV